MAKNDYYVLVAKILVFLYRKLKGQISTKAEDYIIPMSKDFPVQEDYLNFVLMEMNRHEMIQGIKTTRAWGGDEIIISDLNHIMITQEGIDYLRENSAIRKALEQVPGAAAIAQLFL